MNELRQAIAFILDLASQIINELDDDTMLALTDLINMVSERLGEMEQEPIGEGLPTEPELQPGIQSSNIHSFGYDKDNGRLLIKFQGDYPQENGPTYAYSGVPQVIFDLFRKGSIPARTEGKNAWGRWWKGKTPSLGASLYTLIKETGYPYQRLT